MKNIILSLKTTLLLLTIFAFIYPLSVFLIGDLLFHSQSNGSLIKKNGTVIGSEIIAQSFKEAKYFHPRPSACNFRADKSSASNLAVTSQELHEIIQKNIDAYRKENSLSSNFEVPEDAITSSGSGLDPHISLQNALVQMIRVAKERNMDLDKLRMLIHKHTSSSIFGETKVNVLLLNVDLDY